MEIQNINIQSTFEELMQRLRTGETTALPELAAFAQENRDFPDPWAHLAWNLYCQGELEKAEQAALHLSRLIPETPDVYRLLSRIHYNQGRLGESLTAARQAVNVAQEPFAFRMDLIENLLNYQRPIQALREYRQLRREQSPINLIPAKLLLRILAEGGLNGLSRLIYPLSFRVWFFDRLYRHFMHKRQFGKAYLFAKSPFLSPEREGAQAECAGDCLYTKRDFLNPEFENEITLRRQALRSRQPEALEKLARVTLHAGQAQIAINLLHKEDDLSPFGKEILAHALSLNRNIEIAIGLYQELSDLNPIHWVNAGISALAIGDFQIASRPLLQAQEHCAGHPLAEFLYEVCQLRLQGHNPNAEELDVIVQQLANKNRWRKRISEPEQNWEQAIIHLLDTKKYRLIPCPHCGSSSYTPMYLDPVPHWVRGRCDACGFLFANPQILPKHIPELYINEASQSGPLQRFFRRMLEENLALPQEEAGNMFERKERWWEPEFSLADFERQRGPHRRMLDVGCSVGTLMYQFHCREWRAEGIDLDPHGVAVAQSIGLEARVVPFEEADFAPDTFDYITLMDVIEHVPDYKPLLAKLYAILKSGGVLKIKTPCPESVIHYTYGSQWVSSDTHLMYFSRRILLAALRQQGFEIVATRSYLEANKITHTYSHWREQNITPLFDQLVIDWDIGDTILVLARKL